MIQYTATKPFARVAVYIFFAAVCIWLNYFTPRTDFSRVALLYTALFAAYFHILFYWRETKFMQEAAAVSLLCRGLLLFALPNLSDDYFRFVWDGNLSLYGINPYAYTPNQYTQALGLQTAEIDEEVFNGLNSKDYFSVYPSVCQLFFLVTAACSFGNMHLQVILLKLVIFFSEAGTIFFLQKIIRLKNIPAHNLLLYALNPLIIIELSGNIHFEAVMIFFISASLFLFFKNFMSTSAALFGLAAAVKLWPLFLLPLLYGWQFWKKNIQYTVIATLVFVLSFLPFWDPYVLHNITDSMRLYFYAFEFNAGLYNCLKYLTASNPESKLLIQELLPICFLLLLFILFILRNRIDVIYALLFAFFFYLLLATTVHPWYITPLLFLSVFTSFRFPVVWSLLICFTYITYQGGSFVENYFIILLEYVILLLYVLYELFKKKTYTEFKQ